MFLFEALFFFCFTFDNVLQRYLFDPLVFDPMGLAYIHVYFYDYMYDYFYDYFCFVLGVSIFKSSNNKSYY